MFNCSIVILKFIHIYLTNIHLCFQRDVLALLHRFQTIFQFFRFPGLHINSTNLNIQLCISCGNNILGEIIIHLI